MHNPNVSVMIRKAADLTLYAQDLDKLSSGLRSVETLARVEQMRRETRARVEAQLDALSDQVPFEMIFDFWAEVYDRVSARLEERARKARELRYQREYRERMRAAG